MEKKYSALRIIGTIYKIFGIIVGVLAVLAAITLCATSIFGGSLLGQLGGQFGFDGGMGNGGGIIVGLLLGAGVIINGGGMALTLYAIGEGIYLLIALEENTRATVLLLKKEE